MVNWRIVLALLMVVLPCSVLGHPNQVHPSTDPAAPMPGDPLCEPAPAEKGGAYRPGSVIVNSFDQEWHNVNGCKQYSKLMLVTSDDPDLQRLIELVPGQRYLHQLTLVMDDQTSEDILRSLPAPEQMYKLTLGGPADGHVMQLPASLSRYTNVLQLFLSYGGPDFPQGLNELPEMQSLLLVGTNNLGAPEWLAQMPKLVQFEAMYPHLEDSVEEKWRHAGVDGGLLAALGISPTLCDPEASNIEYFSVRYGDIESFDTDRSLDCESIRDQ